MELVLQVKIKSIILHGGELCSGSIQALCLSLSSCLRGFLTGLTVVLQLLFFDVDGLYMHPSSSTQTANYDWNSFDNWCQIQLPICVEDIFSLLPSWWRLALSFSYPSSHLSFAEKVQLHLMFKKFSRPERLNDMRIYVFSNEILWKALWLPFQCFQRRLFSFCWRTTRWSRSAPDYWTWKINEQKREQEDGFLMPTSLPVTSTFASAEMGPNRVVYPKLEAFGPYDPIYLLCWLTNRSSSLCWENASWCKYIWWVFRRSHLK